MTTLDALVATTIRYLRPALEDYSPCYHEPTDDILRAALIECRNQALEDAAKACESAPDLLQNSTFDGCAAAIRALKE